MKTEITIYFLKAHTTNYSFNCEINIRSILSDDESQNALLASTLVIPDNNTSLKLNEKEEIKVLLSKLTNVNTSTTIWENFYCLQSKKLYQTYPYHQSLPPSDPHIDNLIDYVASCTPRKEPILVYIHIDKTDCDIPQAAAILCVSNMNEKTINDAILDFTRTKK